MNKFFPKKAFYAFRFAAQLLKAFAKRFLSVLKRFTRFLGVLSVLYPFFIRSIGVLILGSRDVRSAPVGGLNQLLVRHGHNNSRFLVLPGKKGRSGTRRGCGDNGHSTAVLIFLRG
jgi:hypothetical protein